eukprot:TCALIF_13403-PA protein Name:"Protein of unknown function" AED:0.15 eAED:0.15 QI:0/-1/0/1/-1/1/1/0/194
MSSTRVQLVYHELEQQEFQAFLYFDHVIVNTNPDTILETADGHELQAHQIVLASLSNLFRQTFQHLQIDSQPRQEPVRLLLKKVGSRALRSVLTLLYKGGVRMLASNYFEFREAAKYLQVNGFVEESPVGSHQCGHFNRPLHLRMRAALGGHAFPNEDALGPRPMDDHAANEKSDLHSIQTGDVSSDSSLDQDY